METSQPGDENVTTNPQKPNRVSPGHDSWNNRSLLHVIPLSLSSVADAVEQLFT